MTLRKILCMVLALAMALGTLALAESDDLQASLDAANARIAELEAQVEKYKPVYDSQIVAEYGDGKVILLNDARESYDTVASLYAQYGISMADYADEIKESILLGMVENAIKEDKIAELGLDQPDEATLAELTRLANEDWENYVSYASQSYADSGLSEEEIREKAIERLTQAGYSEENLLNNRISEYADEALTAYITKDVTIDDDEIEEAYSEMVDNDRGDYEDSDHTYNAARGSGSLITWNPEGYRAVKHVLVKFNDEQAAQYSELKSTLESLNAELDALDKAENEAEEKVEEAEAESPAEEAVEEAAEEAVPRAREEIQSDIGKVGASIEALYSELLPKAQEVIDAFNNGTDFDALIAQYGEDPGMTREPTATIGYAVAADSTYWDKAFTAGAMSIASIGQISEPVRGDNGIHIIYYMSDITPGEVPLEEIRDQVAESALEDKKTTAYDDQVAEWVDEANVEYHMERFI